MLIALFLLVIVALVVTVAISSAIANQKPPVRNQTPARRPSPTVQKPPHRNFKQRSNGRTSAPTQRRVDRGPIRKIYGPDRIGIVGFHDRGFVIARPAEPYAQWLQNRSQQLHAKIGGGSTNLTDGLRKAVEMLEKCPRGVLRRIWLLTDGYPNREADSINAVVQAARRAHINVNTIGFGDVYDEALLKRIASMTHNGKFVPVRTLRQLSEALVKAEHRRRDHQRRHQAETTVLAIDLSPSMIAPMDGKRKVAVVEEAVLRLLHYKRECFA